MALTPMENLRLDVECQVINARVAAYDTGSDGYDYDATETEHYTALIMAHIANYLVADHALLVAVVEAVRDHCAPCDVPGDLDDTCWVACPDAGLCKALAACGLSAKEDPNADT